MKKAWHFFCILSCLFFIAGCGLVTEQVGSVDDSTPIVVGLITSEPTTALPSPAEPTPSPSPEVEQWPVPIVDGDAPAGIGSRNFSSSIQLIPYADKLYYIGQSGNDAENLAPLNLWQINRDGSERILILDEATIVKKVNSISGYNYGNPGDIVKIDQDRIYFKVYVFPSTGDAFAQLYSVGMQGEDMQLEQELVENDAIPDRNSTVAEEYTYRIVNDKIMRIDGSGKEEIVYQNEGMSLRDITVLGDWMFFMERSSVNATNSRLCVANALTQVQHNVLEFQQDPFWFAGSINIIGNWLYFINSDLLLCRMPINGGTVETVSSTPIFDYVLYDQTIFYFPAEIVPGNTGELGFSSLLRRMDLDGANDTAIDSFES